MQSRDCRPEPSGTLPLRQHSEGPEKGGTGTPPDHQGHQSGRAWRIQARACTAAGISCGACVSPAEPLQSAGLSGSTGQAQLPVFPPQEAQEFSSTEELRGGRARAWQQPGTRVWPGLRAAFCAARRKQALAPPLETLLGRVTPGSRPSRAGLRHPASELPFLPQQHWAWPLP